MKPKKKEPMKKEQMKAQSKQVEYQLSCEVLLRLPYLCSLSICSSFLRDRSSARPKQADVGLHCKSRRCG